jgi:WD40 repeat protein
MIEQVTTTHTRLSRFDSLAAMKAAYGDLSKQRREGDEQILSNAADFIRLARATGAILPVESERWDAQTLIDYWVNLLCREGVRVEDKETVLAKFDPDQAPTLNESRRPYVGLDAFNEALHEIFFGRQKLVEEMLKKLEDKRWLSVLGESGSGKSSLVQAGLLPQLKAGGVKGSEGWHYFPRAVPGADPLLNLAALAAPTTSQPAGWLEEQAKTMAQDSGHLLRLVNQASPDTPAFILIDQFEEIFTLTTDEAVRQAFIENILQVVEYPDLRHTIVVTMRSDNEDYVTKIEKLKARFADNSIRITALSSTELREAIEKPAERINLKFEDGLVDELVKQVLGEPGGLPLLQFTLLKLWKMRRQNLITWEAFKKLVSCRDALTNSADDVYKGLEPNDRERAKRIFLRLVRPSAGIEVFNNRVPRDSLYLKGEGREHTDRVLERFITAGLLRETESNTQGNAKIEVAHEALIRHWKMLIAWLNEERVNVRSRIQLAEAAKRWDKERDPYLLLRGASLEEARKLEDLNKLEKLFVDASHNRQRRWKIFMWTTASVAVVFLIFVALKYYNDNKVLAAAVERAGKAEAEANSRQLAALSTSYKNDHLDLALLLGLQAFAVSDTSEAESSLMNALGQSPQIIAYLQGQKSPSKSLAFDEGGKTLVSATEDNSVNSWDAVTFKNTSAHGPLFEGALAVEFSPDHHFAAVETSDKRLILANADNGQEIRVLELTKPDGQLSIVGDLAFSPNGKMLAAGFNGAVVIWDVETGKQVRRFALNGELADILAFSSDNSMMAAVTSWGGFIWVWNVASKQRVSNVNLNNINATAIAFRPKDNNILAIGTSDDGILVRDLKSSKAGNLPTQGVSVDALAFSPDGKWLASGNSDKNVVVWEIGETFPLDPETIDEDAEKTRSSGHTNNIKALAFSPDGKRLASGDADNNVILWAVEKRWPLAVELLPTASSREQQTGKEPSDTSDTPSPPRLTSAMALSPDGKTLAAIATENPTENISGDTDRTIKTILLWHVAEDKENYERIKIPKGDPTVEASQSQTQRSGNSQNARPPIIRASSSIAFSPDNHKIATINGMTSVALLDIGEGSDSNAKQFTQLPLREASSQLETKLEKVTTLRFGSEKNLLAIAGVSGGNPFVYLWDLSANSVRQTLKLQSEFKGTVSRISFRPADKIVAVVFTPQSRNQSDKSKENYEIVGLFDVDSGRQINQFVSSQTAESGSQSRRRNLISRSRTDVAWSADGNTLAIGFADTVDLWDMQDASAQKRIGHLQIQRAGAVTSLSFCRNGSTLAVGGLEGSVELWDVKARRPQGSLTVSDGVLLISIVRGPDGNTLFTNSSYNRILMWDLRLESWKERACITANREFTPTELEQFAISKDAYKSPCKLP